MYIVYLTSGSYSDYNLDCILTSKLNPIPILDSFVKQESNGLWDTYESMRAKDFIWIRRCYEPNPYSSEQIEQGEERSILRDKIMKKLPQILRNNGFKDTEALEIWVD